MSILSIVRRGGILSAGLFLVAGLTVAGEGQTTMKKVPPSRTAVDSGQEMYHAYCAVCHGADGKGGGPAVPALKDPVPDLTTMAQRNGGKYPAERVTSVLRFGSERLTAHGSKDMPIWGPVFESRSSNAKATSTLRIHNLTEYLGTLQAK